MDRNSNCWYIDTCDKECDGCTTYKYMLWQFDNSGLPKSKYKPISLIASDENLPVFQRLSAIRKDIVNFVDSGKNLYICSNNTGTGKTSWAIKMLHTYFHYTAQTNIWNLKGMFVSVPTLLLKLKDFDNPLSKEFKDRLNTVDLLILDDIALSGLQTYDYIQLFSLIDTRMLAEKSIIFTSNITSYDDLMDIVGSRIASRVWGNSEIIEIKGGDWRG